MDATTVAVDLAKNVFQLVIADAHWRIKGRLRLRRAQFERWFDNRMAGTVIMEVCGSAPRWGRVLQQRGIQCQTQQDRCARRGGAAGGGALRRYRAGEGQEHRAAVPAGPAPCALWLDCYAHGPDQSPMPLSTIGAAVTQISMSARERLLPHQMPDIRLQALSEGPDPRSIFLLAEGVHIQS